MFFPINNCLINREVFKELITSIDNLFYPDHNLNSAISELTKRIYPDLFKKLSKLKDFVYSDKKLKNLSYKNCNLNLNDNLISTK